MPNDKYNKNQMNRYVFEMYNFYKREADGKVKIKRGGRVILRERQIQEGRDLEGEGECEAKNEDEMGENAEDKIKHMWERTI